MTSPWQPPDPSVTETPIRAQPQYGEMAPPGYVSPVAPPPAPPVAPDYSAPTYYSAPPVVRKTRTADIAITSVLLALGLIGMFVGVASSVGLKAGLAGEASKYGVTYDAPSNLAALGAIIAISHVVLYLAALGVSIPLMITRRVAFWVPLVAGVVAAIIFWVILFSLIASDQTLLNALSAGNS
ncbi:MAG: hypothetical protein QOH69_1839 [Actinomycetota bacterium]|nr:hypothetical protein [Actinomycetota bacterium]